MSDPVQAIIDDLGDWRGAMLARVRAIVRGTDPAIVEEIKWRKLTNPAGVPVWSRGGIVCTGESYRDKVKLTFPHGRALPDPSGLFNAGLTGVRRAIDVAEGQTTDADALAALVRAAVAHNQRDR